MPIRSLQPFRDQRNSEVLSDIAIVIRDKARPGTPERALEPIDINFWTLPEGYPDVTAGKRRDTANTSER